MSLIERLFSWAKNSLPSIPFLESRCGTTFNVCTERISFRAPRVKKYANAEVQTDVSEHKVSHSTATEETGCMVDNMTETDEEVPYRGQSVECEVKALPRKFGSQGGQKSIGFSFHDNWKEKNTKRNSGRNMFIFKSLEEKVALPEHKISRTKVEPVKESPPPQLKKQEPKSESDNKSTESESEHPVSESSEERSKIFESENTSESGERGEEEESYESEKPTDSSETESQETSGRDTTESESNDGFSL